MCSSDLILAGIIQLYYLRLGIFFGCLGIFSRLIPLQALISSVPELTKRGSFNAVNSAVQQTAGGVASVVAGHIVSVDAAGRILDLPLVGYVVVGSTLVSAVLVWRIQLSVRQRLQLATTPTSASAL